MTAEVIARVVADLRAGRVRNALPGDPELYQRALRRCQHADLTVVDATAIYQSLLKVDRPVYLYEDHPCIAPPWRDAAVCYTNEHGNVLVMQTSADEIPKADRRELWPAAPFLDRHKVPEHKLAQLRTLDDPIDWSRVRWVIDTFVWLGGRSDALGGSFPTSGPVHLWRFAVYETGEPADLRWVLLIPDYPQQHWDMAHLVLLGALNFMNCRNVELVEPTRERHQRRRLARLGVTVKTINVFPISRSTRSGPKPDGGGQGTPLVSIVGHFAHYGPEYDRGLLFGKLTGRYWIPQHARGAREHGHAQHDYRLQPSGGSPGDA